MTEEQIPFRRQRRIAARRDQIMDSAERLFAERGFHRATTRDIAKAADVSEGTLYNYFKDKNDLLMGIMSRLVEQQHISQRLTAGLPQDAPGFLRAMLSWRKMFVDQNENALKSLVSEIMVDPVLRRRYYDELVAPGLTMVAFHLRERAHSGQIRPLDPELAAIILLSLTTGLWFFDVMEDEMVHQRWDEIVELLISLLFEGAAPRTSEAKD
ncbi:MAG: TetR/AcrR family transcriptional regulator [Anaerolineales bacterium]|nr:TetR/AcrR family transcriptional regulator [Anaerolineales bacterium]